MKATSSLLNQGVKKAAAFFAGNEVQDAVVEKSKSFFKQEGGSIPISSEGVYEYPEQDVIVPTDNGRITMKNVNYPILGIDEHGNKKMMMPGKEYQYPGKVITEYPQIKSKRFKK